MLVIDKVIRQSIGSGSVRESLRSWNAADEDRNLHMHKDYPRETVSLRARARGLESGHQHNCPIAFDH